MTALPLPVATHDQTGQVADGEPQPSPALDLKHETLDYSRNRRRGPQSKIAQLPLEIRALINHLLGEDKEYHQIIQEVANRGFSINHENLSKWFNGPYQNHLAALDYHDELDQLREHALFGDQSVNFRFQQGLVQIGLTEIFRSIKEGRLRENPALSISLFNALAKLSRESMVIHKYADQQAKEKVLELSKKDPNREINEVELTAAQDRADDFFGWKSAERLKREWAAQSNCRSRGDEALISESSVQQPSSETPSDGRARQSLRAAEPAINQPTPATPIQAILKSEESSPTLSPSPTNCRSRGDEALISKHSTPHESPSPTVSQPSSETPSDGRARQSLRAAEPEVQASLPATPIPAVLKSEDSSTSSPTLSVASSETPSDGRARQSLRAAEPAFTQPTPSVPIPAILKSEESSPTLSPSPTNCRSRGDEALISKHSTPHESPSPTVSQPSSETLSDGRALQSLSAAEPSFTQPTPGAPIPAILKSEESSTLSETLSRSLSAEPQIPAAPIRAVLKSEEAALSNSATLSVEAVSTDQDSNRKSTKSENRIPSKVSRLFQKLVGSKPQAAKSEPAPPPSAYRPSPAEASAMLRMEPPASEHSTIPEFGTPKKHLLPPLNDRSSRSGEALVTESSAPPQSSSPPSSEPSSSTLSNPSSSDAGPLQPTRAIPAPQSKIKIHQNSKMEEERCLECHTVLPTLRPGGGRPFARCQRCNVLLPPPGSAVLPSIEKCHQCGANIPRLLPDGTRPTPYCPNCETPLRDPFVPKAA